jgi:hypothetical protein
MSLNLYRCATWQSPHRYGGPSPHFSQAFYCVALPRAPRRTVEYVCGALSRAPSIHARLRRLATKTLEKGGLGALRDEEPHDARRGSCY